MQLLPHVVAGLLPEGATALNATLTRAACRQALVTPVAHCGTHQMLQPQLHL